MASLYKRSKQVGSRTVITSPFWWIKFIDPANIKRDKQGRPVPTRRSTGFKIGNGPDTRRARELEAACTLQERQWCRGDNRAFWDLWVTDFLNLRYNACAGTLERAHTCWRTLRQFLTEKNIAAPQHLTRENCFDYMRWRNHPNKAAGKYRACHNTALLELKFLRVIMREAVARKYAAANPCAELGIKRAEAGIKPELTPEITALIRQKIQTVKDEALKAMLHHSFEIAYHHGVRLGATWLNPMTDVWHDAEGWKIRFTQKGNRTSTKFLHPNLIPMFEKLRAEGKTETYPKPPRRQNTTTRWSKFLKQHGIKAALPGVTFHSTRVTVVTALARKGVDQRIAMNYVDHASTTVHKIYLRLKPQDSSKVCHDAIP